MSTDLLDSFLASRALTWITGFITGLGIGLMIAGR